MMSGRRDDEVREYETETGGWDPRRKVTNTYFYKHIQAALENMNFVLYLLAWVNEG